MKQTNGSLLNIHNLKTYFYMLGNVRRSVDGVDLIVKEREVLGLVGESGCGKSVTCLSILRLIPEPPGRIVSGEILFRGKNLLKINSKDLRNVRGNEISMVFQEPMTSLNPVITCGEQIAEVIRSHLHVSKREAAEQTIELIHMVGIPDPVRRMKEYPHQLSGGMLQRIMICIALACKPALLIADEPTTALDVTIQAQILDLLRRLQEQYQMAVLLITHDFGVISEMADRVAVMYAGKIQETASVKELFREPKHPYTRGLMASLPSLSRGKDRLVTLPGSVPDPGAFPDGCRFHPRCPIADNYCRTEEPPLEIKYSNHLVRCWKV